MLFRLSQLMLWCLFCLLQQIKFNIFAVLNLYPNKFLVFLLTLQLQPRQISFQEHQRDFHSVWYERKLFIKSKASSDCRSIQLGIWRRGIVLLKSSWLHKCLASYYLWKRFLILLIHRSLHKSNKIWRWLKATRKNLQRGKGPKVTFSPTPPSIGLITAGIPSPRSFAWGRRALLLLFWESSLCHEDSPGYYQYFDFLRASVAPRSNISGARVISPPSHWFVASVGTFTSLPLPSADGG